MSDCSREAWQAPRGIDGAVHWQGGTESELHYARFVNGEERKAECIELDGVRFERVRECEVESSLHWDSYHESDFYEHKFSCGHTVTSDYEEPPLYCEECGAKVKVDECQTSR